MKRFLVAVALTLSFMTASGAGVRVIDGDSVDFDGIPIRIIEIDTPETFRARCAREAVLGLAAKTRLIELLRDARVTYTAKGYDPYGRVLAHLYANDVNVADVLLAEGHAIPYRRGSQAKAARLAHWCRQ